MELVMEGAAWVLILRRGFRLGRARAGRGCPRLTPAKVISSKRR